MAALKAKGRLIFALVWADVCSLLLLSCPHKYLQTEAGVLGKHCEPFPETPL